jgi:hypothetical protein
LIKASIWYKRMHRLPTSISKEMAYIALKVAVFILKSVIVSVAAFIN